MCANQASRAKSTFPTKPSIDANYAYFYNLRIGDGGHVAFSGGMEGSDVNESNRGGLWAGMPGQIVNVVRHGQTVPEVNRQIVDVNFGQLNIHGELAIEGGLSGSPGGGVIWTGIPTQVQVAARTGAQAPGVEPGVVFSGFSPTSLFARFESVQFNDLSQLTFRSYLTGPGIPIGQHGIWIGHVDDLRLVARTDSQAHGLPAGITYSSISGAFNPGGILAYRAFLKGPSITEANDVGLWSGPTDNIRLIAREGDPVPGVASATFSQLNVGSWEVEQSGHVLFTARITGSQIDVSNNFGYWLSSGEDLLPLFRSGQQAPGIPGSRLRDFRVEAAISNEYILLANFEGPDVTAANDSAMFMGVPENMRLVYREGDPAPGTPPGVVMGRVLTSSLGIPVSQSGQLAFRTELTGSGVTSANDAAYFLVDTDGTLFMIAREGSMFDVGGGEFKQIQGLHDTFGGPSDETMNSQGQLFFRARFADASEGVFIAQVVPEPNSIALVASVVVSGAALMLRRRMSRGPAR